MENLDVCFLGLVFLTLGLIGGGFYTFLYVFIPIGFIYLFVGVFSILQYTPSEIS